MKALTITLLLVVALCGLAFLWLGLRFPNSQYWPALAIECLSLVVGIGVINNLLTRHERKRWAAADAVVSRRVSEFVSNSLVSIANASQIQRKSLGDFMIANADTGGLAIYRWSEEEIEPGLKRARGGFDVKARKTIANAVREVSTLADQLIMVLGPRLEPMDLKSFLTISELCTKILWPFQAVPELLDAGTAYNAAAQKELDDMWHRLGANTADDLKRLCETLRTLGAHHVTSTKPAG